jgi:hypothetical protein
MRVKSQKLSTMLLLILVGVTASANAQPLQIKEQGSFAVGGTVLTHPGKFDPYAPTPAGQTPPPAGQTFHGDHAYVFYQLPVKARQLPLVMWHGAGQFSKTWETTPDCRARHVCPGRTDKLAFASVGTDADRDDRRGLGAAGRRRETRNQS